MRIQIGLESVNIDVRGLSGRIMNDQKFWRFAATTWHRLYHKYVPMREGPLANEVRFRPKEIEHTVPYAHYQYYGDRFNHFGPPKKKGKKVGRPQGHPKASARWDQKAAPEQGRKLASTLQAYIDSGRIRFQ